MGPKKNKTQTNPEPKRKLLSRPEDDDDINSIDEAVEDINIIEDDDGIVSDEGSGEDLMQNMEKDYEKISELDAYDQQGIDNDDYDAMDPEERKNVEKLLFERDLLENQVRGPKGARIAKAILDELDSDSDEENLNRKMKNYYRMNFIKSNEEEDDKEIKNAENYINREDVKGSLDEWLRQPHVIRYIQLTFSKFLRTYTDDRGNLVYEGRIVEMGSNNLQSLEVSYPHIVKFSSNLASWLIQYPEHIISILDLVAYMAIEEIFPDFSHIHKEVFVRIRDIPLNDNLRDLRHSHLNNLIKIRGVVTKRTMVFPQLKKIMFYCTKCGTTKGPFYYNGQDEISIGSCLVCQSNGPFNIDFNETIYRNYQKLTIQESPGTVPPGRVPRQKETILTNDLVDTVRPGDEVEITGVYKSRFDISTNIKHCFPVFSTFIETNFVKRLNELELSELTEEDKAEIRKLSKNNNIANLIFESIAPSIYGNNFIKKALALSMFGGVPKDVDGKHKIRGDINVLVLGDPGLAKSQFLKYVQKAFHRSVYTTGKGASAVGLTAGVHKDPVTREWTLEGGALVLADQGICLIDEFDKMNDQDRTSIHEAMEQQSISISKAGIVTTLQARCSVIAAANPINGRYNNQLNFSDNVYLTDPILSRFDILCVVKDEVDLQTDDALSTFVINSHIKSHPKGHQNNLLEERLRIEKEKIPQHLLKKYIMYARKYIQPKLHDVNRNKVSKFYAELRKESDLAGGIPIAVRHLESLIRISESFAKMHLREYVRADDIDNAIKIILESFLMSQKSSISKNLRKKFVNYLSSNEDTQQLLLNVLNKNISQQIQYLKSINGLENLPNEIVVKKDSFEKDAKDFGIYSFDDFYNSSAFLVRNRLEGKEILCRLI